MNNDLTIFITNLLNTIKGWYLTIPKWKEIFKILEYSKVLDVNVNAVRIYGREFKSSYSIDDNLAY